ncbi:extracellular solute-binding protein [Rhodobacterales bacterium HKCCE2091]|nr:extracellular solute-binding protein [Rhodobacterales bacterium HKCCE2091]
MSSRNSHKRLAGLLAAGALAATLAAPAGAQTMDELVAAAQEEGALTVYANTDPSILQSLADAFEETYGIPADIQRQGSSALAQRFTAERESGNTIADIYLSTDRAFHDDSVAEGIFTSLEGIPGIADWPEEALREGVATVGYNPYSLVYNANLVPDGLDSWEDLVDPELAGQVLLTDPRSGVTSNQFYLMLRDLYGDDFLVQLGQNATFSQSAVPGIQQVAAGAQSVYAPGIHQVAVGLIASGAPLAESFPEPTISSDNQVSVVAEAPHPNAARLFVSFMLTPEAQALNNPDGFPPIAGIPNTREMPEVVEIDPAEAQAASEELAQLLGL